MTADDALTAYGRRVGYTREQLALFTPGDPRARQIIALGRVAGQYSIQAQVVEACHCNSGYQVGDTFMLDVDGNLIPKLCPKRLCVYLVSQMVLPVALINERLGQGLDPNQTHFAMRVRCPDVGVECGGYGQVAVQVSVVPRPGKA